MIKIPYGADLYKPLSELVNYVRKKYYDITEVFRNTIQPTSGLELALAGVPNNLMVSPYAPPQYNHISYSVARSNLNNSPNNANSESNKIYTIKRIGFEGRKKVAVWRSDGSRILLKKSEANGQRLKDYVSKKLGEEQITASGGELNTIVSMLENPH